MSAYLTAVGWVVARLSADPVLAALVDDRVFEGVVPDGERGLLVLIQPYGDSSDTTYQSGARALTDLELAVRVWSSTGESAASSLSDLAAAAGRVDAVLSGARSQARPGGVVSGCRRTGELTSTEVTDGQVVRSLGGRYRLLVAPTV